MNSTNKGPRCFTAFRYISLHCPGTQFDPPPANNIYSSSIHNIRKLANNSFLRFSFVSDFSCCLYSMENCSFCLKLSHNSGGGWKSTRSLLYVLCLQDVIYDNEERGTLKIHFKLAKHSHENRNKPSNNFLPDLFPRACV